MIRLWLHGRTIGALPPCVAYGIADQELVSDRPLAAADEFTIPNPSRLDTAPLEAASQAAGGEPIYGGPAWIGGRWLDVECRHQGAGFGLAVDGVGQFEIAPGGEWIRSSGGPWSEDHPGLESTLLGPVVLLALALRRRWALHASAAALSCGAAAFLGSSGVGKSTLASRLAATGWQPAADDLLPLRLTRSGAEVLPRYPQLKLDRQWGISGGDEPDPGGNRGSRSRTARLQRRRVSSRILP